MDNNSFQLEDPEEPESSSNLNPLEIELLRCFCLSRDGYQCANPLCRKTVHDLILEDQIIRRLKGKPERKLPILVVNHRDGSKAINSIYKGKIIPYGNVCLYCYACNRKYDIKNPEIRSDEARTYAARKSHQARPQFVRMVNNFLTKFEHVCLKKSINQFSKTIACSQELCEQSYLQQYGIRWEEINVADYDISCDYNYCSGVHIIFKNEPPRKIEEDNVVAKKEQNKNVSKNTSL